MLMWNNLRSSFWFIPSLIVVLNIALAIGLIELEIMMPDFIIVKWAHFFGAGAEGARGMMTTIAGAMISIVGVTFSIILVVLALASNQYSSRILRNFIRSRDTQVVLGVFSGIFTYCIVILRAIRSGEEGSFVPNLSVFFGFILALLGVGVLIYFIHHIATSIQANNIIAAISDETSEAFDLLFPENEESNSKSPEEMKSYIERFTWLEINSEKTGYIQNVDSPKLLDLTHKKNVIIKLEHEIGDFVIKNTPLFSIANLEAPDGKIISELLSTFTIHLSRTVEQDPKFGIRQIVDIGLKALSPGINDTTTAVTCIDYLTGILTQIAPRQMPSPYKFHNGELRIIVNTLEFDKLLCESFDQIRNFSRGNTAMIFSLYKSFEIISKFTMDKNRREALSKQAAITNELAEKTIQLESDKIRLKEKFIHTLSILEA